MDSRLFLLAAVAAAAAAVPVEWREPVAASGNGHSADEERRITLRERIASARGRVRDEAVVASSPRLGALASTGAARRHGASSSRSGSRAASWTRRRRPARRPRRAGRPARERPSRGDAVAEHAAFRKAVDFGVECDPDLVALTGDIVSHPRAARPVVRELERLRPPLGIVAVLGNHDVGASNDPFSRGAIIDDWGSAPVTLLRGETHAIEARGARIEVGGLDADAWLAGVRRPRESCSPARPTCACSFRTSRRPPRRLRRIRADLVLCGHLHGGQICLPTPWGKLRLAHGVHRFREGIYRDGATTVVVTRGLGTTLVPFRVAARPEVRLLRLRPA